MKKILKLLSIFILAISSIVIKRDFVMAYSSINVPITINVEGVDGTVEVSNWPGTMNDNRYDTNGPLPTVTSRRIGAYNSYTFQFSFDTFGNYVYKVEQPATENTGNDVVYDKKVYRLYITVIDDGTGNNLIGIAEAEDCGINGQSCQYDNTTPVTVTNTTTKSDKIEFVNEQLYWVKYTNGEEPYYYYGGNENQADKTDGVHGSSSEYNNGNPSEINKKYSVDYPTKNNTVTPNSGWVFTGEYDYIITRDKIDSNGNKVLDAKGNVVQEVVPPEEYIFEGKYYPTKKDAEKAVDAYNAANPNSTKSYNDIKTSVLKDSITGKQINPKGTTTDPTSIQTKGNITFIPRYTAKTYWVRYENGDHGKSSGSGNETGKPYGSTHKGGNVVTPNSGYKFTGIYTYTIYKDDGTKETATISADKVNTLTITGNIILTPIYEPIKQSSSKPPKGAPDTGDNANIALYGSLFGGSLILILILLVRRRKKKA